MTSDRLLSLLRLNSIYLFKIVLKRSLRLEMSQILKLKSSKSFQSRRSSQRSGRKRKRRLRILKSPSPCRSSLLWTQLSRQVTLGAQHQVLSADLSQEGTLGAQTRDRLAWQLCLAKLPPSSLEKLHCLTLGNSSLRLSHASAMTHSLSCRKNFH